MAPLATPMPGQIFGIWRFVCELPRGPRDSRCVVLVCPAGHETKKGLSIVYTAHLSKSCKACRSAARTAALPRVRATAVSLPVLPSDGHMEAGRGERRDECVGYSACLRAAIDISPSARCPAACAHYVAAPRELELYGASPLAAAQDDAPGHFGGVYASLKAKPCGLRKTAAKSVRRAA